MRDFKAVPIMVLAPLSKPYFYLSAEELSVGTYVEVPFGSRKALGVVWYESKEESKDIPLNKLKKIETVFCFPPIHKTHQQFLERVAIYTMSEIGNVLKLSLSVSAALKNPKKIKAYQLIEPLLLDQKITPQRQTVIDYLKNHKRPVEASIVKKRCQSSPALLKKMVEVGLIREFFIDPTALPVTLEKAQSVKLTADQQKAVDFLQTDYEEKDFSIGLIDGVTGAGKTEVYFELIEKNLKNNEQSLVLLPEIALTQQILSRFEKRFGFAPTLWHSHLTPAQRRDNWRLIAKGDAKVIVGARSALFLPYPNLKRIIIDEEHDPAYKQEEGVRYHARDMAVLRSWVFGGQVILASATPSLETVENVRQGKYKAFVLPARYGHARLPDIHLIDLKKDKPNKDCWISPTLADALQQCFIKKEQSLLFINRRGYAPLTLCRECGHRFQCPHCESWLVSHTRFHRLQCHHCGYLEPLVNNCPSCGSIDSLYACGPGADRLLEEVRKIIPLARIVVFTSDHMTSPEIMKTTIEQITRGYFDILIGTQMLAKGHHFPNLTTVGVVDADMGMSGGDLRASERNYQLLHQVSGRAGREQKAGHVYIQTFQPENKVIQALASGDRESFNQTELQEREFSHMPPFSRLVSLIISGPDQSAVEEYTKALAHHAPSTDEVMIFGPAPAPIGLLRGQFRYRFLVKAEKHIHIQKTLSYWLKQIKKPTAIKCQVDVDPMNFL